MATGVVGRRTSLRWLVIFVLLGLAAAAIVRDPLSARGQEPGDQVAGLVEAGLIAPKVAADLAANGGADAILVLNDSAIHAAFETTKRDAGISDDTDQIREAKAQAFASLKAGVAQSAGPGMTVLRDYDHIATQFVHFDSAAALAGAASDIRTLAIVENGENFATMAESMPLIQQPLAQLSGRIGTGAAVAVLDTGLDYTLPFFGCTAVNTPAATCKVVHVADAAPSDGLLDDAGQGKHGTNVTGNVSAVAPGAKLLNFDVFQGASAFNADVLTALNAIITNTSLGGTPIKAVNMSIGDSQHQTATCAASYATAAFASLRTAGVIPVVAAGNGAHVPNDGPYSDGIAGPACTPGALSVGAVYDSNIGNSPGWLNCPSFDATTAADQITCFSQSASILGMLAPGAMSDVGPIQQGGTSQAAPKVAGAIAVLAAAAPSQTVDQRQASLTGSGPQITDARNGQTKRRLDLCAALINAGSSCPGGTSNDNRVNATPITSSPALFRQSTFTFTTEGGDPVPSCGVAGNQNSKSAWFKLQTGTAGTLVASTVDSHYPTEFGNDTVMAVYRDDNGTLTQVGCSDDIDFGNDNYYSAVNVALAADKNYLIEVMAWGATSGNIGGYLVLNVSYSGTFGAGGPVTDSLAWTGQPANRGVGEALPNLTLEARSGGVINSADGSTQITLSLVDETPTLQAIAADDFQVEGTVQPPSSRAASLRQQFAGRGSVRARFAEDGSLASLVGLTEPLTDPSGDTPQEIAARFMESIAEARGIAPGFDSTLRIQKVDDAGMTTIGYSQEIDGLPVFDAYAKVNIAADGSVVSFSSTLLRSGSVVQGASSISEPEAIAAAEAVVGPHAEVPITDDLSANANSQFQPKVKVMAYDAGDHLSAGFVVLVPQTDNYFMVLVDAFTGAVMYSTSLTSHVGPEGTVFTEHPDAGPRTVVPFQGTVPNHTTWVTTGQTGGWTCPAVATIAQPCLIGNNVATILARNGTTGPGFFTAFNAAQEFNFPFVDAWNLLGLTDGGTGLNADYPATLATLFYFNNYVHDWLYQLGFDEAAGNFQHTNIGGGAASDSVNSFAQYGASVCDIPQSSCRNNANFSTPPDGFEGVMRMYLFNAASNGSPRRDGSLDGDVVVHEYGHGVSNRLIDPLEANGLQGPQARAMGEGWSDFFSFSAYNDPVMGEYVTTDAIKGIRHFAYDNHPWTYSHLCTSNFGLGPECEEHNDGEIWAAALWDMRAALMNAGVTSDTVVKLVLDGLKATPELPNFLQARDAIIAANLATRGGANACLIWQAFADRGMGTNAQNDNNDDESAVDGFNVPAQCGGVELSNCSPLTHTVASGTTTWTGCTVGAAGTYRIAATSNGLTTQTSNQFVIGGGGGSGPATKLAFSGQPSNGVSAIALPGQPQVQVQDANSQVVTGSNATVTLELVAPPTLQAPPVPPESESRQPLTGKDSLLPSFLETSTPTNQWAAWLTPGSDPLTVAAALGATYIQPATPLENAYIFEFPGATGFADPSVVAALEGSTSVVQYEQQVILPSAPRSLPTDPGVASQWHIKNNGSGGGIAGVDINVEPAWDAGFHGEGVVVGIVDDGLEHTHSDLSGNYSAALSFDYIGNDTNPTPESGNNHGTAVAGLVGATANNAVCGTGVAYASTIAGIRGGGFSITDATESSMLVHQSQSIDIYNNSWGPSDNGIIAPIGSLALAAIQNGVTTGRGGLGNIYVWAGGNGRGNNDNTAYDGYASLRQVIAVGAILRNGDFSSYSEPGAPLLVVAPGGPLAGDIYTTDRAGANGYNGTDCTGTFNGTSSASPIAAGAIAVILGANPNLGYRDIQHILVRTATKNDPTDSDWTVNGAGRQINHNYGFGLINTNAARVMAQTWTNVGPEQSATSGLQTVNAAIPDNNPTGVSRVVTMPGTLKLEHVELVFNATHAFRGDLEVSLTSPAGTVSKLANVRIQDGGVNYTNWKFTSTRYWDENVAGNWTVTVKDSSGGISGTWDNFTLNFFGTIPTGAGPAVLTCDGGLSKAAVNGVASFTGCKVTGDGAGYTIRATATALTQATSNAFEITDPAFDATCNGSLDAGDSLAVMRQVAGFNTGGVVAPCTGDANLNLGVDIDDAIIIRRRTAGLP